MHTVELARFATTAASGNLQEAMHQLHLSHEPQGISLVAIFALAALWAQVCPEDWCSVMILTHCQNFPEKYRAEMENVDLTQFITQPEERGGSWEQGKAYLWLQGFCPCQNSKVLFQTIEILLLV